MLALLHALGALILGEMQEKRYRSDSEAVLDEKLLVEVTRMNGLCSFGLALV